MAKRKNNGNDVFELTNVRLYGVGMPVTIGVNNGTITHVGERQGWQECFDGGGQPVICGRIDPHVHDRDPGFTHKEDVSSIQNAALYGGTTCVAAMANTKPCITTAERLGSKLAGVKRSPLTYMQWLGATCTNHRELIAAQHIHGFAGIKLCMAITTHTEEMLISHKYDQEQWCKIAAEHRTLVAVHAENQARITQLERKYRQRYTLEDHCEIRDGQSELEAVQQILEIGRKTGCRLHICHVSTSRALHEIAKARRFHIDVSCELCPHHFLLNMRRGKEECWRYKCNPPLRSQDEVDSLREMLCCDDYDWIMLATDHAPHTIAEKIAHAEDLFRVPSGMPGLDTATWLCWDLVRQRRMEPARFAYLTAEFPAERLGLKKKGKIKAGYDADLVVIDEGAARALRDEDMRTKCGWTPFKGWSVSCGPALVIAKGKVVPNNLKNSSP